MMSPDNRHLEAWDSDYRTRGHLWGGNPASLPALPDNSRVLELGCGNGKNLPGMMEKGWNIYCNGLFHNGTSTLPAGCPVMPDG